MSESFISKYGKLVTLATLPRGLAEALAGALTLKFGISTNMHNEGSGEFGVQYEPDNCAIKHIVIEAYVDGWIDREGAGVE